MILLLILMGGGEEIDMQLLNETNIDEQYEEEYISTEDNIDSDFSDTHTSSIIHALKLIVYLVFMFYINFMWFTIIIVNDKQDNWHIWL